MSRKQARRSRATLLTPFLESATVDLADAADPLLFRKKILPEGTIAYPDPDSPSGRRRVTFDRRYHERLVRAFNDQAVECPTVQLADAGNRHNMDLRLTAGAVQRIEYGGPDEADGPGLYAVIRARNEEHAQLLREIPQLGVSAQIKERVERVDGKKYPAALRHVLVTADPRVVGMGPWRPVSLATDDLDGPVIDLSDIEYEETGMPKRKSGNASGSVRTDDGVLELSDDEIEAALEDAAANLGDAADDDDFEDDDETGDEDDLGVEFSAGRRDGSRVLDFAERLEQQDVELAGVRARLAAADWKGERLELSNAGVPKSMLDLAEKVLKYPGENVLSLSDEDGQEKAVDARRVIRKLLEQARGMVDLSDDVPGSGSEPPLSLSDGGDDADFQAAWAAQAGF